MRSLDSKAAVDGGDIPPVHAPLAVAFGTGGQSADMSARAMCITSHRKAAERGVLVSRYTPAGIVGALLEEMSAESAWTFLEVAARTARAVFEDEKPKEPKEEKTR